MGVSKACCLYAINNGLEDYMSPECFEVLKEIKWGSTKHSSLHTNYINACLLVLNVTNM
jgi:hypothetical protein